ncbi:hypothetical protein V1478_017224 [Vespula squamosa]|uniref:Secreted protein n=1 Tax=Vespula squamosa TaxID=30214 RepID=A0ABD1ZXY0_VESSQ
MSAREWTSFRPISRRIVTAACWILVALCVSEKEDTFAIYSLSRSSTLSERRRNNDDVTYAVIRVEKSNSQLPRSAKRCD